MKDYLGNEITIGCRVITTIGKYHDMVPFEVTKISNQKVQLKRILNPADPVCHTEMERLYLGDINYKFGKQVIVIDSLIVDKKRKEEMFTLEK